MSTPPPAWPHAAHPPSDTEAQGRVPAETREAQAHGACAQRTPQRHAATGAQTRLTSRPASARWAVCRGSSVLETNEEAMVNVVPSGPNSKGLNWTSWGGMCSPELPLGGAPNCPQSEPSQWTTPSVWKPLTVVVQAT